VKKESIVMGLAGLVLGFVLGLVTPALFGHNKGQVAPPPPSQEEEFAFQKPSAEQLEHALKEYKTILKDDPKNANAWLELGDVYYGAQKFNEAIDSYQKVMELDDKNVGAYVQLGNIYYDTKQPEKSIGYYQKALQLKPELSDVRVDMATMYRISEQPDKAIEELHKVNKRDPTHAVAFLNLGIILKGDKKDLAGAKEAWNQFLKLMPGGMQAEEVKKMIRDLNREMGAQEKKTQ